MGFLGKLVKATLDTALIPVAVVQDVVTMGGALTDKKEPYTVTKTKEVIEDVEEAGEDAGDGEWL